MSFRPRNSSTASSSTCSRTASSASGITACWPTASSRKNWRGAASCSVPDCRPPPTSNPTRPPTGCASCWGSTSLAVLVAAQNSTARSSNRPAPHPRMRLFQLTPENFHPGTLPKSRPRHDPAHRLDLGQGEPPAAAETPCADRGVRPAILPVSRPFSLVATPPAAQSRPAKPARPPCRPPALIPTPPPFLYHSPKE